MRCTALPMFKNKFMWYTTFGFTVLLSLLLGEHRECRMTQMPMHFNLTLVFCLETDSRSVLVTSQTCPMARDVQYPQPRAGKIPTCFY